MYVLLVIIIYDLEGRSGPGRGGFHPPSNAEASLRVVRAPYWLTSCVDHGVFPFTDIRLADYAHSRSCVNYHFTLDGIAIEVTESMPARLALVVISIIIIVISSIIITTNTVITWITFWGCARAPQSARAAPGREREPRRAEMSGGRSILYYSIL